MTGNRRAAGLGANGVDLPKHLLAQEIQRPARPFAGPDVRFHLPEMTAEARDLLRHVAPVGVQRHFPHELGVRGGHVHADLLHALLQFLPVSLRDTWRQFFDLPALVLQFRETLHEIRLDGLTFFHSHIDKLPQRRFQSRAHGWPQVFRTLKRPVPDQDLRMCQQRGKGEIVLEFQFACRLAQRADVCAGGGKIHAHSPLACSDRRQTYRPRDAPPGYGLVNQFVDPGFECRYLAREIQPHVELPAVHGTQFHLHLQPAHHRLPPPIPCHAPQCHS